MRAVHPRVYRTLISVASVAVFVGVIIAFLAGTAYALGWPLSEANSQQAIIFGVLFGFPGSMASRFLAVSISLLPWRQKEPFDRLIIAQSLVDAVPVVGTDAIFDSYGVKFIW